MKRFFYIPLAIVVLMEVLNINTPAQTTSQQKVRANIPFTFNVGKVSMPAGHYTVTVVNPSSDQKVLHIHCADGRSSAMVLTMGKLEAASDEARLVFNRYGDRYFFAQVHLAGDETTLAVVKSSAEKAAHRAIGKTNKKMVVEIVAE